MLNRSVAILAAMSLALAPGLAFAQGVNVTRSILPDQPYTQIYPDTMVASGGGGDPLVINHPNAPLQCTLSIVPVEDTGWTADNALNSLNDADVTAAWAESLPGFTLGNKGTAQFQDATALVYDGTSTSSSEGVPVSLVHAETVASARGYALDCIFATAVAEQARPLVDFIIANFSTRSDADCCVGITGQPESASSPQ